MGDGGASCKNPFRTSCEAEETIHSAENDFPQPLPKTPYIAGGAINAAEGPAERGVRRDRRVALLISPFSKGGYRGIFTSFLRRQESRIMAGFACIRTRPRSCAERGMPDPFLGSH